MRNGAESPVDGEVPHSSGGVTVEITIGMLVGSPAQQNKYREVLQRLLLHEPVRAVIRFYPTLPLLRKSLLEEYAWLDILILQADPQNFAFAQEFRAADRHCLILYPARDLDLVLSAFPSMPIAYVPVQNDNSSLGREILRAVDYIRKVKDEISFETKSAVYQYTLDEIDYFESQYRLVHIVTRDRKTDTITAKLDAVQERLPASFARCHQSYLVNMDHIADVDKTAREVHLRSGQSVPSSKKLFAEFLETFRRYRKGDVYAGIS